MVKKKKKKNSPAGDLGDSGSVPELGGSPGGGNGNPLRYSRLEKAHGWRSLVGCSPQGRGESDTTASRCGASSLYVWWATSAAAVHCLILLVSSLQSCKVIFNLTHFKCQNTACPSRLIMVLVFSVHSCGSSSCTKNRNSDS